jgi:hypothetical protein
MDAIDHPISGHEVYCNSGVAMLQLVGMQWNLIGNALSRHFNPYNSGDSNQILTTYRYLA